MTQYPKCQHLAKKLGYFPVENFEPIFILRRRWLKSIPTSTSKHSILFLSLVSTTVSVTHPSRPVDQVIEFGDNIFAPASGHVGFFLDNS